MTRLAAQLASILVCPESRQPLESHEDALKCPATGAQYARNEHGYYDFTLDDALGTFETTSDEYAEDQTAHKRRFYDEFLRPWLDRGNAQRVLEVGTGLGMEIRFLNEEGRQAYGVDVPCLSRFWSRNGNDPARFFCCDGARMPFQNDYFDAVFTLGVIEHVGTQVGHYTLCDDYRAQRRAFANELLRVTKPGGRILVTCPNKTFPIDIAHEPTDAATPPGALRLRRFLYDKTRMTVHPPWGAYHLLSHREVRDLFCRESSATIQALPAKGYFSFQRFGSGPFGLLRPLLSAYVNRLPRALRATPLNPFVIAEIRKA